MTDKQLIDNIFGDKQHYIPDYLMNWITTCPKFGNFLRTYHFKIKKKWRCARDEEDLKDTIFELKVAYLFLLDNRFELKYEKYSIGNSRTPDFSIIFKQSINFNVEVKRIRETDLGIRLKNILKVIGDRIREIPSGLSASINVVIGNHYGKGFINQLESSIEELMQYIKNTIETEEHKLDYGALDEYPIPSFKGELILELSKPLSKYDTKHTSYRDGTMPIFYTQKEHYKFGDTVFEKLGQMLPGTANLLIIGSDSSTHEKEDFFTQIKMVTDSVRQGNDAFFINKRFNGVGDFTAQIKNLSAVLFRSCWIDNSHNRNYLWINKNANFELSEDIIKGIGGCNSLQIVQ